MMKTIIREASIVLLLIVAIGLLLLIVFYDYMPTSKIVPAKVIAYEIPEEVKKELESSTSTSTQDIVKTYVVTATDLGAYESTDNYNKGKENPFDVSSEYKEKNLDSDDEGKEGTSNNKNIVEYTGK